MSNYSKWNIIGKASVFGGMSLGLLSFAAAAIFPPAAPILITAGIATAITGAAIDTCVDHEVKKPQERAYYNDEHDFEESIYDCKPINPKEFYDPCPDYTGYTEEETMEPHFDGEAWKKAQDEQNHKHYSDIGDELTQLRNETSVPKYYQHEGYDLYRAYQAYNEALNSREDRRATNEQIDSYFEETANRYRFK